MIMIMIMIEMNEMEWDNYIDKNYYYISISMSISMTISMSIYYKRIHINELH